MDAEYMMTVCAVCGSCRNEEFIKFKYDLRGAPGSEFRVVKCSACGLLYTEPRLTSAALNAEGAERFVRPGSGQRSRASGFIRHHPLLRRAWHSLTGEYLSRMIAMCSGKVLDIGCGFGEVLEDLALKGCEAYGVDTNPRAVEECVRKGFKAVCGALKDAAFDGDFFDTVILCHSIEHLPDPEAELEEIHRILKSGGTLIIYCPNAASYMAGYFGADWQGWSPPVHLYHFTPGSIRALAKRAGFEAVSVSTATPEYFFLISFNKRMLARKEGVLQAVLRKAGFFSNGNILFRITFSLAARVADFIIPGRGECLRVVLKKR